MCIRSCIHCHRTRCLGPNLQLASVWSSLQGPSTVCLPLQCSASSADPSQPAEQVEMHILRRMKYDASLLMTCVIAVRAGSSDVEVFVKGNAVSISQLCGPGNQPADWGQVSLPSCCLPRHETKSQDCGDLAWAFSEATACAVGRPLVA